MPSTSKIVLAVGQVWRSSKPISNRGRPGNCARQILRYPVEYTPPWLWVDYTTPGKMDRTKYKRCNEQSFRRWVHKNAAFLDTDAKIRQMQEVVKNTARRCVEIALRQPPGTLPLNGSEIATIIQYEFGLDAPPITFVSSTDTVKTGLLYEGTAVDVPLWNRTKIKH